MTIKEIYDTMYAAGLTSSQLEFSRIWLGRSPRYYSHLIAVGREPGLATLCAMVWRLDRLLRASPSRRWDNLLKLKQAISGEIERRAITDVRQSKTRAAYAAGFVEPPAVPEHTGPC